MMTNLPPVTTLHIFARNRAKDGWTREQVIDAIRKRLRLDSVNIANLSTSQRERYWDAVRFLGELEGNNQED